MQGNTSINLICGCCALAAAAATANVPSLASLPDDLTQLPLESLLAIEVTSVSRASQQLASAPSSIQVISRTQLRQSGAQSLPEALRQVTGLQVAQIDGRSWAISARGFNSALSDKLEVRLDGRSLYTPLFSGVLWEFQDVPMDLIERIEVIRGPGASLWGANAVNGVINIVTRSAQDTLGTRLAIGAGDELERRASVQHGQATANGAWRLYLQTRDWDATTSGSGATSHDSRETASAGWRADLTLTPRDELLISLDATDASMGSAQARPGTRETQAGAVALLRWSRRYGERSDHQLQVSYDYFDRDIPGYYGEIREQIDLDFRHRWQPWAAHDLVWGLGFRLSQDQIRNSAAVIFDPAASSLHLFNLFLQDRISLGESLEFTAGARIERNDFTGTEVQPTLRLSWQPGSRDSFWTSLSRASRTPNRVDRDFEIPGLIVTNDSFRAEQAEVAEIGWRRQVSASFSLDLSGFYADYRRLRGIGLSANQEPIVSNEGSGHGSGLELTMQWLPSNHLQVRAGYSYLDLSFRAREGSIDTSIANANQNDPRHQALLHLSWSGPGGTIVDAGLRYVGELVDPGTPSYTELDVHLVRPLSASLELSLRGRNLLQPTHPEFNDGSGALIERSVHAGLRWSF